MSTISITYNLADDADAQAFRVAVAAEDLFLVLIEFYLHAVERDSAGVMAPKNVATEFLRERLSMRSTDWVLKPDAVVPAKWERPRRNVTLTVEGGFAYVALVNAESTFASIRRLAERLAELELPHHSWGAIGDVLLRSLQPNAFADAFHAEIETRGGDTPQN